MDDVALNHGQASLLPIRRSNARGNSAVPGWTSYPPALSRAAAGHQSIHPRPIVPLPARAATQTFPTSFDARVSNPFSTSTSMSLVQSEIQRSHQIGDRVEYLLGSRTDTTQPVASSSRAQFYSAPSSSSAAGSSSSNMPLAPTPLRAHHAQTGFGMYELPSGTAVTPFPSFPSDIPSLPTPSSARSGTSQQDTCGVQGSLPQSSSVSPSTSKRKATSAPTHGTSKRVKKNNVSNPQGTGSAHSTASTVQCNTQDKQGASASRDVPASNDAPLLHPAGNTGPATSAKEPRKRAVDNAWSREAHGCLVPGCPRTEPFSRRQDYWRHICNVKAHAPERAIPGWEVRYKVKRGYKGTLHGCPYISCKHREMEMRNDRVNIHMERCHGMSVKEWKRRVDVLTWRWKRDRIWTAKDEKSKVWVYEEAVNEFEDLPSDLDMFL